MPPFPPLWWGTTPHTLNTKGLDSIVRHKTWGSHWALLPVPLPGQTEASYFSLCHQISYLLNGWMYSSQKKNKKKNPLGWFLSIHRWSDGLRDVLGHATRTWEAFGARLGPASSLVVSPTLVQLRAALQWLFHTCVLTNGDYNPSLPIDPSWWQMHVCLGSLRRCGGEGRG